MTAFSMQNRVKCDARLGILQENGPQRQILEAFIQARYAQIYGADIRHFLPWLLCLSEQGELRSVLGLRPGSSGPFFVEKYLDAPLESIISAEHGCVSRTQIIETGNLAAVGGSSPLLFSLLTQLLYQSGFRWVTFTATTQVKNLLQRLGMHPQWLCNADVTRLGSEAAHWGSYYDANPCVLLGNLEGAYYTLKDNDLAQKALEEYRAELEAMVLLLRPAAQGVVHE